MDLKLFHSLTPGETYLITAERPLSSESVKDIEAYLAKKSKHYDVKFLFIPYGLKIQPDVADIVSEYQKRVNLVNEDLIDTLKKLVECMSENNEQN